MIKTLKVSNDRSLGTAVRVDLGRFTVLVGPNGSGKSNVVSVLSFVADALSIGLSGALTDREGIQAVRRWSSGRPNNLSIALELELEQGPATYSFELTGDRHAEYRVKREMATVWTGDAHHGFEVADGRWLGGPEGLTPPLDPQSLALQLVGGDARFQPLVSALRKTCIYKIFPDTLRQPQKYDPSKPMDEHGANWASILHDQATGSWKPELVEVLHRLTGDIVDVRVRTTAGYLVTDFRHASDTKKAKWLSAAQESDGTLRVAGIVTALLQEPALALVGIEEPELTVHPGAMELLHDYLRQTSRTSQVLVTSHSPELLDLVDAGSVRVVTRSAGTTTVSPMDEAQKQLVKDRLLGLGELLVTGELSLPPAISTG